MSSSRQSHNPSRLRRRILSIRFRPQNQSLPFEGELPMFPFRHLLLGCSMIWSGQSQVRPRPRLDSFHPTLVVRFIFVSTDHESCVAQRASLPDSHRNTVLEFTLRHTGTIFSLRPAIFTRHQRTRTGTIEILDESTPGGTSRTDKLRTCV